MRDRCDRDDQDTKKDSDEDQEEGEEEEQEECRTWKIRASEKARKVFSFSYFRDCEDVSDLHFEYARVARRGAGKFCLTQDQTPMDGRWQLGRVDEKTEIIACPYECGERDWPPSAQRRGGHPASIRSKLARKVGKSSSPIPKALDLIQQLWILEPDTLKATTGTPEQVRALIWSVAQKHRFEYNDGEWRVAQAVNPVGVASASIDPWASGSDPWAAAKSRAQVIPIKDIPERVSDFEEARLLSQFISPKNVPLAQLKRSEYTLGAQAVVLCDGSYASAFLQTAGNATDLVVVLSKSPAKESEVVALKTQILLEVGGERRTQMCWVACIGGTKYSLVQPVADICTLEAGGVPIYVRVNKASVSQQTYDSFCRRDFLPSFFGVIAAQFRVIGKRDFADSEAIVWNLLVPRGSLEHTLSYGGKDEVSVSTTKQEESKLDLHPVWVDSPSAMALRQQLANHQHVGVHGPTQRGQYVVKARREHLGAIRQTLLGELSIYAGIWDIVVDRKYVGKFPADLNMHSVAKSLFAALSWRCVALNSKKQGREFQMITFGSDQELKQQEIAISGHVVILQKLNQKESALATVFHPPVGKANESAPMEEVTENTEEESAIGKNAILLWRRCEGKLLNSKGSILLRLRKRWRNAIKTLNVPLPSNCRRFKSNKRLIGRRFRAVLGILRGGPKRTRLKLVLLILILGRLWIRLRGTPLLSFRKSL